jgi:hypothetical protein
MPDELNGSLRDLLRRGSTGMSIQRRHFLQLASGASAASVSTRIAGAQTLSDAGPAWPAPDDDRVEVGHDKPLQRQQAPL